MTKTDYHPVNVAMAQSVRTHMARAGMTIKALSAGAGIPYATLQRKLKARTWFTVDEVFIISKVLGVDVVELMTPSFDAVKPRGGCLASMPITHEVTAICGLPRGHAGQHEAAGESEQPFRWCACNTPDAATLAKGLPARLEVEEVGQ